MADYNSYEAYTFNDGTGVKTIHCTDHNQPWAHENPHIHDEPGADLDVWISNTTYVNGDRIAYVHSHPQRDGHGKSRPLTAYEKELLRAMRE